MTQCWYEDVLHHINAFCYLLGHRGLVQKRASYPALERKKVLNIIRIGTSRNALSSNVREIALFPVLSAILGNQNILGKFNNACY